MEVTRLWRWAIQPRNAWVLLALLLFDVALSVVIVSKIAYTEIDWKAYMEEVEGFLGGELDYVNLKGSTGPLVYPAAFLYIFAGLRALTSHGTDIFMAQCIFIGVYIANLCTVFSVYRQSGRIPAVLCGALVLSKRIHSIYMLRMFNDCIAVLFGHVAIYFFCNYRWRVGCVFYSTAVAVKMNMFLYAPGLFLVLLLGTGVAETVCCIAICAVVQGLYGLPFLLTHPVSYISKAFELSRVFTYIWTVNFKFLSEEMFVSKTLSLLLLACTALGYLLFARKWLRELRVANVKMPTLMMKPCGNKLSANFIIGTLWTSNLIGIVFARSLHYQFYCWYFHSLPFLLWQTPLPWAVSAVLMVGIEVSYNVFPSTWWSSLLLQCCHLVLLIAAYFSSVPRSPLRVENANSEEAKKNL